jgi:hypothetical protein
MQDVQKHIDDAEDAAKKNTDAILTANEAQFRQRVLNQIKEEIKLMTASIEANELSDAEAHKIRVEVLESVLNALKR